MLPSTIKMITYNKPTIKIITGSFEVANILINQCKVSKKNIYLLKPQKWYDIGMCKIKLDELVHDTPNYALHINYKNKKILYVVDTNSVKHIKAKDYDLYLVENNYQEDIIEKHILECDNEDKLYYLNRVKYTHLSKSKCDEFLINNMGKNSHFQYVHLSNYNNTENGEII